MYRLTTCFWVSVCTASPQGLSAAPKNFQKNNINFQKNNIEPRLLPYPSIVSRHGKPKSPTSVYAYPVLGNLGSIFHLLEILCCTLLHSRALAALGFTACLGCIRLYCRAWLEANTFSNRGLSPRIVGMFL